MTQLKSELHPVIHYRDLTTCLRNAEIAVEAGCEGIVLIHHKGLDHVLDDAARNIRERFPGLKIGINRLSTDPLSAIAQNLRVGVDFTWSDTCGADSSGLHPLGKQIQETLSTAGDHRFFGSVAFKYQQEEVDPPRAARVAFDARFIPTTSGPGTGEAPSIDKIAGMAATLPEKVLAIASGVTPENVRPFLPFVRYFLVSTGISRSFHEFDKERVAALVAIIHET